MSALFVNKDLPSYSGLIFSKLQQKSSIKILVNLAPDVQNMFASFQVFVSVRNYFVNNFLTQLSKSLCLMVMWISHSALFHYGYDISKLSINSTDQNKTLCITQFTCFLLSGE